MGASSLVRMLLLAAAASTNTGRRRDAIASMGHRVHLRSSDLVRGLPPEFSSVLTLPVGMTPAGRGCALLFTADLRSLNVTGQNALRAVREKHSWHHRAQQTLDTLSELRDAEREPLP